MACRLASVPSIRRAFSIALKPYADDTALSIGDLKIENSSDQIAIYGTLDLTRDKAGLQQARQLKALLEEAVRVLEADKDLPDRMAPPEQPQQVNSSIRSSARWQCDQGPAPP